MTRTARISDTEFNLDGPVDISALAERIAERNSAHDDVAELDFDYQPSGGKGNRNRREVRFSA